MAETIDDMRKISRIILLERFCVAGIIGDDRFFLRTGSDHEHLCDKDQKHHSVDRISHEVYFFEPIKSIQFVVMD